MTKSDTPKQFMEYDGKPVIIHTLENFQNNKSIDSIIIVCLENWIDKCWSYVKSFNISKVSDIIPGGTSGQESIYNGLKRAGELYSKDSVVLINDGVRPLINSNLITDCIESVKNYGSAITSTKTTETVLVEDLNGNISFVDRSKCRTAKAPQCFILKDILFSHEKARLEKLEFIDSAMLMSHYGYKLHLVDCSSENIKITTDSDFHSFCALHDYRKGQKND